MNKILIVAEHDNEQLAGATLATVGAATKIGGPIEILVAGADCAAVAEQAAAVEGVSRVLLAEEQRYAKPLAEELTALAVGLAAKYSHLLAPAGTFGKNLMPRISALLDSQQISDIVSVEGEDTFQRPIYAGNALATVRCKEPMKVITVRPSAFEPASAEGGEAPIERIEAASAAELSEFVDQQLSASERPQLDAARVVVSGGRGVGSQENFALIEQLADALGAAVGASRAAVDAGYMPNEYQVGQTGKVVAPELYIAVGISGAIQHLAGMTASKVIVAINKDEEAPIFEIADYGLVGDLFQAVPELTAALE